MRFAASQRILRPLLLLIVISGHACMNDGETGMSMPVSSFKLVNGTPVSDVVYDDYNPILLQLTNGTLAMVFASTRPCAGCSNHNIFVASSAGTYNNDAKVPAFNIPQVITANATPLNYSTRLRLAAKATGNNINVYVKDSLGQISETGMISPVSASPINVGAMLPPIANYYCYSGTLLGLDSTGLMISTAGTSGPISRYNPSAGDMCPYNTFANTAMASAVNISFVRSADIGISEGFLVTDTSGNLTAQTATVKGPVMQLFMTTMAKNSLFLTSATAFLASQPAGDLIVFSAAAASGQQSDMYIITNRTPTALWLKYTNFGAQPLP